jgi:hypothetical protein
MSMPSRPTLNVELTPRGELPRTPTFAPLPQYLRRIPFGLDENGKHIKDIRGNVIKPVITYMLEYVGTQVPPALDQALRVKQAQDAALAQLIERLNAHIPNPLYHVTSDYLFKEGNLYSYEFSAFLHHICNEITGDPHYFFNIGLRIFPDSIRFLFSAISLQQVYLTMAQIGSRFSAEQFETLEPQPNSVVIQRRTPALPEQLGETAWLVHVASGCQTLRAALASFPKIHSGQPLAEIEERQCLLRGDECCEWKFIWQTEKKRGWFSWGKR